MILIIKKIIYWPIVELVQVKGDVYSRSDGGTHSASFLHGGDLHPGVSIQQSSRRTCVREKRWTVRINQLKNQQQIGSGRLLSSQMNVRQLGLYGCFWKAPDIWLISVGRFVFRALFSSLMEHTLVKRERSWCFCESTLPMCPASRPNWAHSLFQLSAGDATIYQNIISRPGAAVLKSWFITQPRADLITFWNCQQMCLFWKWIMVKISCAY
jgi:hypothetical protein